MLDVKNDTRFDVSRITGEMTDMICLLAKELSSLGVTERSHVAIVAPECRQKNMFYLATVGLGAIPVCLHENTEEKELLKLLKRIECSVLITSRKILSCDRKKEVFERFCHVIFLEDTGLNGKSLKDVSALEGIVNAAKTIGKTCVIA